jgi:dTDP-glucose pyrophosphorylase
MISLDQEESRVKFVLEQNKTIGDAVRLLNDHSLRIVLVIEGSNKLRGVITDGDIRRGLIRGLDLSNFVTEIVKSKPLVVTSDVPPPLARQIMQANAVQHLPVVSHEGKLLGIHLLDGAGQKIRNPELFVIMAGGKGTRLWPHTQNCPKPMLPVNGKPMLQHIIERARDDGFQKFVLAINYLGNMIKEHFGDGSEFGVKIEYLQEEQPLGTAGALSLISATPTVPVLVTNGDVLTDVKYSEILDFHKRYGAKATMAVRQYEWQHPFGVVRTNGMEIIGFDEKPVTRTHINAGIYILEPDVLGLLSKNTPCNMPELFIKAQNFRHKTMAYPMHEPWLDVGRPVDLEKANERNT